MCHASYSTGDVYGKGLPSFVFLVLGVDAAVVDEKIAVCAPVCVRATRISDRDSLPAAIDPRLPLALQLCLTSLGHSQQGFGTCTCYPATR